MLNYLYHIYYICSRQSPLTRTTFASIVSPSPKDSISTFGSTVLIFVMRSVNSKTMWRNGHMDRSVPELQRLHISPLRSEDIRDAVSWPGVRSARGPPSAVRTEENYPISPNFFNLDSIPPLCLPNSSTSSSIVLPDRYSAINFSSSSSVHDSYVCGWAFQTSFTEYALDLPECIYPRSWSISR